MGGRASRVVAAKPRVVKPTQDTPPVVSASQVERPNEEYVPFQEPLEQRDSSFEKQLQHLGDRISSVDTVFVKGSDPVSAEAKRKKRRELRQHMLRGRLTTTHFKEILIQQRTHPNRQEWIQQLAEKYEVDAALLSQALQFYRFPKLRKRYDGYVVADLWETR